jgi:hypothetical protein
MAWDPPNNRAVLFGGRTSSYSDSTFGDTWAWDGKTWTRVSAANPMAVQPLPPTPLPCPASSSFGLLIAAGNLEMIDTCGKVSASAPLAAPSVQTCGAGGERASLAAPVSASNNRVYFRDGDTKVRSLTLDGKTEDVTTVPGGPTTVSFFSVSPDDQRIAVMVEDLSASDIGLRLYVEDLHGGGHHADIYAGRVPQTTGNTLWPMGWHQGLLVLAAIGACAPDPASLSPVEWQLVDPATGNRSLSITQRMPYRGCVLPCMEGAPCILGTWPSPAGVTCVDFAGTLAVSTWSGGLLAGFPANVAGNNVGSGASPSGHRTFVTGPINQIYGASGTIVTAGLGAPSDPQYYWNGYEWLSSTHGFTWAIGHQACVWIDEDHVLASDAIIGMASPDFPDSYYAPVTPLATSGTCAGRFPGGL